MDALKLTLVESESTSVNLPNLGEITWAHWGSFMGNFTLTGVLVCSIGLNKNVSEAKVRFTESYGLLPPQKSSMASLWVLFINTSNRNTYSTTLVSSIHRSCQLSTIEFITFLQGTFSARLCVSKVFLRLKKPVLWLACVQGLPPYLGRPSCLSSCSGPPLACSLHMAVFSSPIQLPLWKMWGGHNVMACGVCYLWRSQVLFIAAEHTHRPPSFLVFVPLL